MFSCYISRCIKSPYKTIDKTTLIIKNEKDLEVESKVNKHIDNLKKYDYGKYFKFNVNQDFIYDEHNQYIFKITLNSDYD